MSQELTDAIVKVVVLAIVSLVAWGFRQLFAVLVVYLKAKLGIERYEMVQRYTSTVVRYLEQSPAFRELNGEAKKEMAVMAIKVFCEKNGLNIETETIDKLIEESVQILNAEIKPLFIEETPLKTVGLIPEK